MGMMGSVSRIGRYLGYRTFILYPQLPLTFCSEIQCQVEDSPSGKKSEELPENLKVSCSDGNFTGKTADKFQEKSQEFKTFNHYCFYFSQGMLKIDFMTNRNEAQKTRLDRISVSSVINWLLS